MLASIYICININITLSVTFLPVLLQIETAPAVSGFVGVDKEVGFSEVDDVGSFNFCRSFSSAIGCVLVTKFLSRSL